QQAGAVTARAVAPLSRLLGYAAPLLKGRGVALFPKGVRVEDELTEARKAWKMQVIRFPSRTDPSGTILKIMGIRRVKRCATPRRPFRPASRRHRPPEWTRRPDDAG